MSSSAYVHTPVSTAKMRKGADAGQAREGMMKKTGWINPENPLNDNSVRRNAF